MNEERQVNRKVRISVVLLVLLTLVLAACSPSALPQTGSDTSELNFEFNDTEIATPQDIRSGYATINGTNTGETPRVLMMARLKNDVTAEQFMQSFQENPDTTADLVTLIGGSSAPPGGSVEFTVNLQEGTHVAVGFPQSDAPPTLAVFEVAAGEETGSPPQADAQVDLVDFSFEFPETIQGGEQTWEITNTGTQWHEIYLVQLEPGVTEEQLLDMIMSEEEPQGPPPWEDVATLGPVSEGETTWVTMNLEPGEYTAVCFLPDLSGSGQPHVMLGMIESFTVTGE